MVLNKQTKNAHRIKKEKMHIGLAASEEKVQKHLGMQKRVKQSKVHRSSCFKGAWRHELIWPIVNEEKGTMTCPAFKDADDENTFVTGSVDFPRLQ